ncbi:MAG: efflux RND transporter periplasmic adaptor subunit [Tatlockia sp.]|nr:efflux RND transporter periplasmic adaptor subunit [Tatlockia sp.]
MIIMLFSVAIVFSLIFAWKYYKGLMIQQYLKTVSSPIKTVSTMKITSSLWQPKLKAVGSLRARVGVNVTTELPGMVQTIHFTPGAEVQKGQVMVQLNAAAEIGLLHALQAQVELAKITYERDKRQFAARAVAKQVVDTDEWNLKKLQAQVEEQTATVEKKTIKAPFTGRVGINNINPGQYLNVGNIVTTLQALDPIYADFFMPQQALAKLKNNQAVTITVDTFPGRIFNGRITTIQPAVESASRNVLIEATIPNPKLILTPGMFAQVEVDVANPINYITVPQSAITFNPYGDIAYIVVDEGKKDDKNQLILTVRQVFVILGDSRGDQVAVLKGLKKGDIVVTSGQLKLKNGSRIAINNNIQPSNQADPKVEEK